MRCWLLSILLVITVQASGQYFDKMFFIGWAANAPLTNKEFVGSPTPLGARFGYRELINPKFVVGVDLTMATYDEYIPRQTYYSPGSAMTTDFTHLVNSWGATLSGEYLFREDKQLMPYAGFGAGIAYNNYQVYYNIFSAADNAFGFLARPRVGAWLKFSQRSSWGLNASIHLEYSTTKSEDMGYKYFMNPGFEIGLVRLEW
jgi:hypothetical protein